MKKSYTDYISPLFLLIILWAILIGVNGWIRPLEPSNELHYASIAWEMFQHRHFLVPIQTGHPYAEKTPFLYWLIHLGWIAFGVSTWWVRLLPELFMLGSLLVTRKLAQLLWPEQRTLAVLAPLIVLGSTIWALQYQITWFDMFIIFFVLSSWYYLYVAVQQPSKIHWIIWGVITGLGLLAKGPVIFLFVLPTALIAPWWGSPREKWANIYISIGLAILLSIVLFLCWAIPAVLWGGSQYAHDLFFKQTVGRMTGAHGPNRTWYFYLLNLPLLLMPWVLWFQPWKAVWKYFHSQENHKDFPKLIFLGSAILTSLFILSLFSTKSLGYVFPIIPLLSILITLFLLKSPQVASPWDRLFLGLIYILIGVLYFLTPYFLSIKTQLHYFWITELSPFWGYGFIVFGIFWLWWQETRLTLVVTVLTVSSVLFCLLIQLSIFRIEARYNDWRPLSLKIAQLQSLHIPVAFPSGDDAPEELFEFFGRLSQPIVILRNQTQDWIKKNPDGWLVIRDREVSPAQYDLYPAIIFDGKVP